MRQRERQRENSCFSTFDLIIMDRLMDQQTNEWTDGQTKPLLDSTTKRLRDFAASMHNHHLGQFAVQIDFNNLIPHFLEKCKKCKKIKKDSENHSSGTIDRTEFCLASSERGDLALS